MAKPWKVFVEFEQVCTSVAVETQQSLKATCVSTATDVHTLIPQELKGPLQLAKNAVKCTDFNVNPFSPTLFLIAAKMSLPKRSVSYWSDPPILIFWHPDTLALSSERQSARMSKNWKGWVRPVWPWTLWSVTIWHHTTGLERVKFRKCPHISGIGHSFLCRTLPHIPHTEIAGFASDNVLETQMKFVLRTRVQECRSAVGQTCLEIRM